MKKNNSLFIIMFSTFISVSTMVTYNNYVKNSNPYEEGKSRELGVVQYNKASVSRNTITSDNHVKVVKKDDKQTLDTKDALGGDDLPKEKLIDDYKSKDKKNSNNSNVNSSNVSVEKNNKSKAIYNEIYLLKRADSLENYYYDNKENEQSVFKVSTGEIKENLTNFDKMKLLHVSMKLGKEDYKQVKEYLYAQDAEEGVLKALKLLKVDLPKEEYEKIRKIAAKFIDMDAAERLN
jgi:hypothetical protein